MANLTETTPNRKAGPSDEVLSGACLLVLLLAHILIWTLVATIAQSSGALHHDMTEAYDWGREFQLGYHKHPPLFAWIAGVWFLVFPRADWAFYALSAVSAAGGLLGVWCIAGRLLPGRERTIALLLVMLTPLFNVMAMTFNGNAVLLLIWPWTLWAFIRSVQTGRTSDGLLFGVIAGLALLSKYSSILLLASCLAAALLHPRGRAYFASPAPYAAIAACVLVCLPHAVWALQHRLTTVTYVLEKPHLPLASLVVKAASSLLGAMALYALPFAAIVGLVGWPKAREQLARCLATAGQRDQIWLTVLAVGPVLLTLGLGFATGVKVSTNYLLPALFLMPIAATVFGLPRAAGGSLSVLWRFLAGWFAVALLAAPLAAILSFTSGTAQAVEPRREVAIEATRAWHEAFGRPLRFVAGSEAYGLGAPFYSPDAPELFDILKPDTLPWASLEDVSREGLLIICLKTDAGCLERAKRLSSVGAQVRSLHLARSYLWWTAAGYDFQLIMLPPSTTRG